MLWTDSAGGWTGEPAVFVLYSDGTYQFLQDRFDPDADPHSGGEDPPPGLFEPVLGFGKVWREEPGVREALGWATAEEAHGAGRLETFHGGTMIWVSQRQETYVLSYYERTYVVHSSPTFDLPPLPSAPLSSFLDRWVDVSVPATQSSAQRAFTFLPDDAIAFHNCTGSYELLEGARMYVNVDDCASPVLPGGIYEYAVDDSEEILVMSQRFGATHIGSPNTYWHQEDNDYDVAILGHKALMIDEGRCSGQVERQSGCWLQVSSITCDRGHSPLAEATYKLTYRGTEMILARQFRRSEE